MSKQTNTILDKFLNQSGSYVTGWEAYLDGEECPYAAPENSETARDWYRGWKDAELVMTEIDVV